MRQRRTAKSAEAGSETARRRQVEAGDVVLTGRPPECLGLDHRIGGMGGTGRLAAARAMAIHEAEEGTVKFVGHAAAKAASAKAHARLQTTLRTCVGHLMLIRQLTN